MAWSSRLLKTALVLVVISVFLTLAQTWAQQRPVMASSLTQPEAPAYSTWRKAVSSRAEVELELLSLETVKEGEEA